MANQIFIACFVLCLAWQAHAAVTCTAGGRFADPADSTCRNYTLCVYSSITATYLGFNYVCPSTSLFSPLISQCTAPANYVCNATTTVANTTTSVCTADGFIADPSSTTCSSYIECVLINGTFTETTFTCPDTTFYNPTSTLCETDFNCTTTTPFNCTTAGRYADTTDTTCQNYFYCVLLTTGSYTQYNYTCPSTSMFNPTTSMCTATYTCTNT